jgi:hypothetical protein
MFDKLRSLLRARPPARGGWYYLGGGVGLALTHFGRKIFLPGEDYGMTTEIILKGQWEPHVEAVLRRHLKPGQQVAEIGASIGFHTLVMAEAVGATGHIHSFEPYPKVLPCCAGPSPPTISAAASRCTKPRSWIAPGKSASPRTRPRPAAPTSPSPSPPPTTPRDSRRPPCGSTMPWPMSPP